MPIGVIVNVLSVVLGGIAGSLVGNKLSKDFKENLNLIFAVCALAMGIPSIATMENMPAVIFAVVIGTALGLLIHFGDLVSLAGKKMGQVVGKIFPQDSSSVSEEEFLATLVTIFVLFCASGTGIYGTIVSGISGDHSILIAKSILDFFTALIFATMLGPVVSFIAIPQTIIFLCLFFLASVIYPLTTPTMINDFKAAGGILLLATGFRMMKVRAFPTADMIPAMILAMPCSAIWVNHIIPMIG